MKKFLVRGVVTIVAIGALSGCDPRTVQDWRTTARRGQHVHVQCEHWTPDNNASCK